MPTLEFTLETISPMFLNGADPRGHPEFRAASVRGQLRYWLRAILGAQTSDLKEVWERESSIFGSTAMGSAVSVRVRALKPVETGKYPMLPHRLNGKGNAEAIKPTNRFQLDCVTRPGCEMPEEFVQALSTWFLLGGMGKRSRRMFGGLRLRKAVSDEHTKVYMDTNPWWTSRLPSRDAYVEALRNHFKWIFIDQIRNKQWASWQNTPSFPTLHPKHCHVMVGKEEHQDWEEANQALFGLLRGSFRQHEKMFGFASGQGRRASPLIAQVRKIGDAYFPVLTLMRSPLGKGQPLDANVLNSFLKAFDGEMVWGEAIP